MTSGQFLRAVAATNPVHANQWIPELTTRKKKECKHTPLPFSFRIKKVDNLKSNTVFENEGRLKNHSLIANVCLQKSWRQTSGCASLDCILQRHLIFLLFFSPLLFQLPKPRVLGLFYWAVSRQWTALQGSWPTPRARGVGRGLRPGVGSREDHSLQHW